MLCLGLEHFFIEVSEVLRAPRINEVVFICCLVSLVPFPLVSFSRWAINTKTKSRHWAPRFFESWAKKSGRQQAAT